MPHRWFLNVGLGIYKKGRWILRNNLCGVSERINQVNLDTIKKTPAGAGTHTLETTVCTDNCEIFRGKHQQDVSSPRWNVPITHSRMSSEEMKCVAMSLQLA